MKMVAASAAAAAWVLALGTVAVAGAPTPSAPTTVKGMEPAAEAVAGPTALPAAGGGAVWADPDSHLLLDALGRTLVFHGVNAVEKEAPFLPTSGAFNTRNSLTPEDAAMLQGWGMNVVRLGVMWPAVTPAPVGPAVLPSKTCRAVTVSVWW